MKKSKNGNLKRSVIFMLSKVVHVNGDLNNPNIVTSVAGLAALGAFGGGICYVCSGKFSVGGGLLASSLGFGAVYKYLSDKDAIQKKMDYVHEEKMAKIKHPNNIAKAKDETTLPAYLTPLDMTPASHTLNELANAAGVELLPLFGIYLYAGDVSIFFSTANKGKTVVAIQMAIDIATGKQSLFSEDNDKPKQKVVYINFEMKTGQMKNRLTGRDGKANITFPENIDMRDCMGCFKDVNEFLSYLAKIVETDLATDTTIFIDTITDICPQFFSKEASMVLNTFRTIQTHAFQKKGITLTFVIEGHASKKHDWEPMELENLKGSVNQANLADSIFALGCGVEESRYLKVLKARNDKRPETVDVIKIVKSDYLRPELIGTVLEEDILPPKKKPNKKGMAGVTPPSGEQEPAWDGKLSLDKTKEMKAFYQKNVNGHGWQATAEKFGLSDHKAVKREFERLEKYLEATGKNS